jgi:hypothetical protein
MVNELEEYLRILKHLKTGQVPPVYRTSLSSCMVIKCSWHSETISSKLDSVEKRLREKSESFYLKAVEMAGYSRTNLTPFPALVKMNSDTQLEIKLFQIFYKK